MAIDDDDEKRGTLKSSQLFGRLMRVSMFLRTLLPKLAATRIPTLLAVALVLYFALLFSGTAGGPYNMHEPDTLSTETLDSNPSSLHDPFQLEDLRISPETVPSLAEAQLDAQSLKTLTLKSPGISGGVLHTGDHFGGCWGSGSVICMRG